MAIAHFTPGFWIQCEKQAKNDQKAALFHPNRLFLAKNRWKPRFK
jgi:hypothetical protein